MTKEHNLRSLHAVAKTPLGEKQVNVLLGRTQEIAMCTFVLLPSTPALNQVDRVYSSYSVEDELNENHCAQLDDLILNRKSYNEFLEEFLVGNGGESYQNRSFREEWFVRRPAQKLSKEEVLVLSIHLCLAAREDVALKDVAMLWGKHTKTIRSYRKKLMERFASFSRGDSE
eukprot:CAMPEP_0113654166 /NCGR_PEP_ID=MMETSP0017_2-20120614/29007_1 /TAXON_ID=2856 /ORGANISM="Cylindrotheca closterium" /LENGTH=171 /DNA_ID=CAMNT_0000567287 /DNA_START=56 /DNA_END=571 /DNA_ORIENTATION=- /assembly_acc=CAM_ASM_000147